jgi:exopolyphosphatase
LSDLPFPVTGKDSEEKNELGENSKWFLVDHNVLTGDIGHQFSDKVVGVIDHHVDEHKHSLTTSPTEGEGRAIRPVGSCMTLAIQTLRDTWPERHDKWDEELAYLALGPILVDTDNCTNKDKTTQEDIDAEEFLEALATDFLRDSYVGEIKKKKKDIGDLTVEEILRKDFKQWTEGDIVLGVSSVVRSIAWLVKKAGGEDEFVGLVEKFGKERAIGQGKKGLGLCCVMASSSDKGGRFRREIFLLARTAEAKKAGEKFEKEAQENLGLKGWDEGNLDLDTGGEEDGNGGWRKCFVQEKTENSRKQVAPLLREAMV